MKSRQNQLSREVYDTRDFIARSAAVIRVHGWSPNTPTKECVMNDFSDFAVGDIVDIAIPGGRSRRQVVMDVGRNLEGEVFAIFCQCESGDRGWWYNFSAWDIVRISNERALGEDDE